MTNTVLYLVDSGCKWRQLPHDFPPHFTAHSFYRRARFSCAYPKIKGYCVDKGYRGTFIYDAYVLLYCRVDISVMERIFAWLNNSRRLSKD